MSIFLELSAWFHVAWQDLDNVWSTIELQPLKVGLTTTPGVSQQEPAS